MNNDGSAGNVRSDLSAFVAAWCNRYAVTALPPQMSYKVDEPCSLNDSQDRTAMNWTRLLLDPR